MLSKDCFFSLPCLVSITMSGDLLPSWLSRAMEKPDIDPVLVWDFEVALTGLRKTVIAINALLVQFEVEDKFGGGVLQHNIRELWNATCLLWYVHIPEYKHLHGVIESHKGADESKRRWHLTPEFVSIEYSYKAVFRFNRDLPILLRGLAHSVDKDGVIICRSGQSLPLSGSFGDTSDNNDEGSLSCVRSGVDDKADLYGDEPDWV